MKNFLIFFQYKSVVFLAILLFSFFASATLPERLQQSAGTRPRYHLGRPDQARKPTAARRGHRGPQGAHLDHGLRHHAPSSLPNRSRGQPQGQLLRQARFRPQYGRDSTQKLQRVRPRLAGQRRKSGQSQQQN